MFGLPGSGHANGLMSLDDIASTSHMLAKEDNAEVPNSISDAKLDSTVYDPESETWTTGVPVINLDPARSLSPKPVVATAPPPDRRSLIYNNAFQYAALLLAVFIVPFVARYLLRVWRGE